jgi:hypothetical protein
MSTGDGTQEPAARVSWARPIVVTILVTVVAGALIATFSLRGELSPVAGPSATVTLPARTHAPHNVVAQASPSVSANPVSPSPVGLTVPRYPLLPTAGAGGVVWVGNRDGTITRIRSPNEVDVIKAASGEIMSLAARFSGSAWAIARSGAGHGVSLVKIDKEPENISLKATAIRGMAMVGSRVCLLSEDSVIVIDKDNTPHDPFPAPAASRFIVAAKSVYVASSSEVAQYTTSGEAVGQPLRFDGVVAMALSPTGPARGLWVSTSTQLLRVDPRTMKVGRVWAHFASPPVTIASTRDAVWLLFADGAVRAIGQTPATSLTTTLPIKPIGFMAQGGNGYVIGSNGFIYAVNASDGRKHGTVKSFPNAPCDHCQRGA